MQQNNLLCNLLHPYNYLMTREMQMSSQQPPSLTFEFEIIHAAGNVVDYRLSCAKLTSFYLMRNLMHSI